MSPQSTLPSLNACMHCGLCLQSCPTYLVTGSETDSPRGRLALLGAVDEGRLTDMQIQEPLGRCVACRACEPVCPSAVPYHELLAAHQERTVSDSQKKRLSTWLGSRRRQSFAASAARFANRSGLLSLARRFAPDSLKRLAEAVPAKPRVFRFKAGAVFPASAPQRGSLALHLGCVDPHVYGEVLQHTVAVLTEEGFAVSIPHQPACCGALESHAGAGEGGRARGLETIQALQGADAVIVPAAGCHAFLQQLDAQTPILDPMAFLQQQGIRGELRRIDEDIAWDPPCHQQNVASCSGSTLELLKQIPALRLKEHKEADLCCGAGGIAFLREPELTGEIGARKVQHLLEVQPQRIVTGNPGCRIQLEGSLRRAANPLPVIHPISLLAESLGVAGNGSGSD
ncbi:MAG: (Fe-S)-binding protein [Planctomycetota bacterium]|jgi:glycolate oxidase iron-sulfur subunit